MRKTSYTMKGFTLVEIMIVVAIIAILLVIAIPIFTHARETSQKSTCIANLRLIDCAITSWALEAHKGVGADIDTSALFGTTNLLREQPVCPAGGTFLFQTVGAKPQVACSFSDLGHVLP